jgi:transcriptional regulator with XRE-family HTH domain
MRRKLSDQLRQAIADSGITRYRISKATGINEAALGKFFHGERGLSLESIDKLAEFLKLELTVRKGRN